eukprot:jgi/Bigna1/141880/aug1.65_g16588
MLPDEIPLSLTDISVEDLVATRRRAVNANTKNKPLGGRICGFRHHCNPRNLSKEEKQRKLKKKPSVLPRILVKKNFDLCNGSLLSYCDLDIIEKLQKGETDEEAFEEFWNNRILKNKKGARRIPSRIVNKEEENINAALDELLPLCDSVQQRLYRMRKKAFIFRDEAFWAGGTLGGEDEARGGGRDRGDVQEEGAEQHGGVIMFDSRRTRRPVGPSIGLSKVVGSSEGAGAVSISFASLGISPDFAGWAMVALMKILYALQIQRALPHTEAGARAHARGSRCLDSKPVGDGEDFHAWSSELTMTLMMLTMMMMMVMKMMWGGGGGGEWLYEIAVGEEIIGRTEQLGEIINEGMCDAARLGESLLCFVIMQTIDKNCRD